MPWKSTARAFPTNCSALFTIWPILVFGLVAIPWFVLSQDDPTIGNEGPDGNPLVCNVYHRRGPIEQSISEGPFFRELANSLSAMKPENDPNCCWFTDNVGRSFKSGRRQLAKIVETDRGNKIEIPYNHIYESKGHLIPMLTGTPSNVHELQFRVVGIEESIEYERCRNLLNTSTYTDLWEWARNNVISFSYSRFSDGRLCRNHIVPVANVKTRINLYESNDIFTHFLNFDVSIDGSLRMHYFRPKKIGFLDVLSGTHEYNNSFPPQGKYDSRGMCPFKFRKLASGGYYIPFRLLPPELYSSSTYFEDYQKQYSRPKECPLRLQFDTTKYKLLIPRPNDASKNIQITDLKIKIEG